MIEERQEAAPGAVVRPLDLSILIVTWNSARWIDRCLRSIPAACEGLAYEVVVHDNASTDDTIAHLGSAQVIRWPVNAGCVTSPSGSGRARSGCCAPAYPRRPRP